MVARLPSAKDLGPLPDARSGRQIATYDASAMRQVGAAWREGLGDLGAGITSFGNSLAAVEHRQKAENDEMEAARFRSEFTTAALGTGQALRSPITQEDLNAPDDNAGGGGAAAPSSGGNAQSPAGSNGGASSAPKMVMPEGATIEAPETSGNSRIDDQVKALEQKRDELLKGVTDPRRRELLRLQTNDDIQRARNLAAQKSNGIWRDKNIAYLAESDKALIARAVEEDDPAVRTKALEDQTQLHRSYVAKGILTEQGYQKWRTNFINTYGEALVEAWQRKGKNADAIRDLKASIEDAAKAPPPQSPTKAPGKRSDLVIENQSGAQTRTQPIQPALKDRLAVAAEQTGVQVEVYSGGQPTREEGGKRTGSERHDHGNSADVKLFVVGEDGQKRYLSSENPEDRKTMAAFISASVRAGATGVGHGPGYMGESGIHVGGGKPAVWGAGGSSANAPDWVRTAYQEGVKTRGTEAPTGERAEAYSKFLGTEKAGQPYKVASADGMTPPPVQGLGDDGSKLPGADVSRPDTPARPKTVFDAMDPLAREKLLKRALDYEEKALVKSQSLANEGYERQIIDAAAGLGDLPKRSAIENAKDISEVQRNTLLRQYDHQAKDIVAIQNVIARLNAGQALNPFEKTDRDAADKIFMAWGGDDAALTRMIQSGRVFPPTAAKTMRGQINSGDTKQVIAALTRGSNAMSANPNIFAGVDGAEDIEKNIIKFRYLVDSGESAERAANTIITQQSREFKSTVNAQIKNENIAEKVKKELSIGDLSGAFDRSFLGLARNPTVGWSVAQRDAMFDEFADRTVEHYKDSNGAAGDWNLAKKLAAEDLKRTWGVTEINGSKVLTRFPAELAPYYASLQDPVNPGTKPIAEMIGRQAALSIKNVTGEDVDPKNIRLSPIPGITAQQYKNGKEPPQYNISWVDKDQIVHYLPPGKAFEAKIGPMREEQQNLREKASQAKQEQNRQYQESLQKDPAWRAGQTIKDYMGTERHRSREDVMRSMNKPPSSPDTSIRLPE